jgi:CheY-like chemotaxis protein
MSTPETEHLHILIVDDDPNVRHILQKMISHLGHTVTTAADGLEALSRLREHDIQLVITDLEMPGMNGIELTRRVNAEFSNVEVLIATGDETLYASTDLSELRAGDVIKKPVSLGELESKIQRIARGRAFPTELPEQGPGKDRNE